MELARSRNKIPLPKSIGGPGIPLPPEQDTLIGPNYQLFIPRKQTQGSADGPEEEEEGSYAPEHSLGPNAAMNPSTDLQTMTPQRVSFPLTAGKRPR